MNCKPGDLAVIVSPHMGGCLVRGDGRFCTVLYLAPRGQFQLPDGMLNLAGKGSPRWVVKLQHPVPVRMSDGVVLDRVYGTIYDKWLRPIRPGDVTDSEVRDLFQPAPVKEVA